MFFFSFLGVKREPQDRGKRTTNNRHQSQSKTSRTRFRYGKDQRDTWSENRRKVRRPESRWNWYIGLRLMQECWIEPISNFLWCFTSFRSWRFWLCRQELSVNWKERKERERRSESGIQIETHGAERAKLTVRKNTTLWDDNVTEESVQFFVILIRMKNRKCVSEIKCEWSERRDILG